MHIFKVAEEERTNVELIHRCLAIRANIQFPSESEPVLQSLCQASKDIPCQKSKADLISEIVEVISCIARNQSLLVCSLCFRILDLHGDISSDLLFSIADAVVNDHMSDFIIEYFVGIVLFLKIRSLTELCSRSLFRVVDVVCKRRPAIACKCILSRLLLSYESGVTRAPVAAHYELFQRILRQVYICRLLHYI